MGKINLIVANATEAFTHSDIAIFQSATKSVEAFISVHFEFDYNVDVVISTPSNLMPTTPEDGISGRTYHSRLIIVVIDKQQAKITEDFVFETLCHEMSHSLRWEKLPEHAGTLLDGAILEGLAIILEEKAMSDTKRKQKQFFLTEMQKTDDHTIHNILSELRGKLKSNDYDYEKTFFIGDKNLPRWAGYRLGYFLVKQYLEQTGETIEQATLTSYDAFKNIKF